MTHLRIGEPAPWFSAPTPSNPNFTTSTVAGRYILYGFLPFDAARREAVYDAVKPYVGRLRDDHVAGFLILREPADFARARDRNGLRFFSDTDGEVSRLFGALTPDGQEHPFWLLLDPSQRILDILPINAVDALFDRIAALPPVEMHAGVTLHAPVMIVPRVLDPELCRELIGYYQRAGGIPSGVMREKDGRTVGVLDDFKKRRDASIDDDALRVTLRNAISRRLLPEVRKAFRYKATRIERYIVACYDASDGGYFRPHRDNRTAGTAHREFACSINLNAEEFEGGDLRFPEYGMRTYRPPTGGAVVFSCSLLHEATSVTRGTRYAFLPFLYDEVGEEVRLRNLHLLGDAPSAAASSAPEG